MFRESVLLTYSARNAHAHNVYLYLLCGCGHGIMITALIVYKII